jgi:cytidine deaminase
MPTELTDPDDKKLVTLARSTRARTRAAEGACVRDLDGRTYAAATVDLPSLQLTAVQVAVAMAVASGSAGLEAVVVLGDAAVVAESDLSAVRDFAGAGVPVHLAAPDGTVVASIAS